ncbi:uncharacterized protein LOC130711687 [Lotus japonicus]|uniref:uncharacterized protein LOC130711687 n=1 Tax=Lotus japonicus TaxID=34305 RepID=UPI002590FE5A|nr:uncharacterized protein LOC130711687 [Lotus japonicus]
MNFVISKNPVNLLNYHSPCSLLRFHVPSLLRSSTTKWTRGSETLRLRASCASSTSAGCYGGWDDLSGSEAPGEFDTLRDFLVSIGIDDRKHVFVFLLGLVCAMAISRVKVSTFLVLPASVLLLAVGFAAGSFQNGTFGEVRVSGSKKREKEKEENLKLPFEKLRSVDEFFDEIDLVIGNLKSDVQSAIRNKKIQVDDLCGYVEVTDRIKLSALNARNIVKTLIDDEEKANGALVENHKSGRRKKQVGEAGYQMLKSISSLFGDDLRSSNSTKVRENVDRELDQTKGNGGVPPVEDRTLNLVDDSKANGKLGSSQDLVTDSVLGMGRYGRMKNNPEIESFDLGDNRRSTNKFPGENKYSYPNKGLRFTNNHSFSLKMDSSSTTDMWESRDNVLDSEGFKVRMKHMESESSYMRKELLDQSHETFRSSHDKRESMSDRSRYAQDRVDYGDHRHLANDLSEGENEFNSPSSAKVSDDVMFDRYLAEATDLLKEAKEFVKGRHDEKQAEILLYRSANLLSKAVDLKPMSLLAVGQLGNTYLLHGELKLKISRELRTLLSGRIQPSSRKHRRILNELQTNITSEEEVTQLLIDVCEECEELLVEAGRKYRLALSIDANDVRALYNWGLALSFRGQLISDIGPGASFEAERVFLAAIDKFDAMLVKGKVYAPDALFRWGMTLQQRSRLRPGSSKEKVKLLQQAKRLYEDALDMDSNNIQVKDALSSCVSELNYRRY